MMLARSVALVDDDRLIADMYRLGLELQGFAVEIHGDGASLFAALETTLPDAVVLDWNLPLMSGGQILDRIRLNWRTRDLPVFILSGLSPRDHAEGVISRLGAIAWLEKTSTTPALLADKVAAVFEESFGRP